MSAQVLSPARVFKKAMKLMGNQFEITVVSPNESWAFERIGEAVAEISRIEALLSTFKDDSETNRINREAGIRPVTVSQETFNLVERSLRISRITQGAFDITYGSVDKRLWNFDTGMESMLDEREARRKVRLIDYRKVILDPERHTVFLKEKGMRIGFGGIGKGYAAERARQLMRSHGVESGIVNASGDLTAWGQQPQGDPWTIGIANPNLQGQIFSYMNITGLAVATSGNYEKFVMIDGKRYSHTINPRTGLPVSGIKSVTIISTNAEIADAMATPVMIMGIRTGLNLIDQIKDIEAIVVDDHDRIFHSKNIHFT